MRIIYTIDVAGSSARVSCTVGPAAGDSGGNPDISVGSDIGGNPDIALGSDVGGNPDIALGSDVGGNPDIALGSDVGGDPDIAVGSDVGGNSGTCNCCRTIILGPTVITGVCAHGKGQGSKTGQKIPPKRKIVTPKDAPASGRRPLSGSKPDFEMDAQEQRNWCWAAVGSAVHKYLPANQTLSQADVVDRIEGDGGVYVDPTQYNKVASLTEVLKKLKNLNKPFAGEVADFDLIRREIDAGCPIAARIAWDPNRDLIEDGAHFVVIADYRTKNGPELQIVDPGVGHIPAGGTPATVEWVPYEGFLDSYRLTGRWVGFYLLSETN